MKGVISQKDYKLSLHKANVNEYHLEALTSIDPFQILFKSLPFPV